MSADKSKHGLSAEVIERNPNVWLATCSCRKRWTGATYEVAEDKWREHVWSITGVAPKAMGDRADRWGPIS